jgi:hypothetical protein
MKLLAPVETASSTKIWPMRVATRITIVYINHQLNKINHKQSYNNSKIVKLEEKVTALHQTVTVTTSLVFMHVDQGVYI